MSNTTQTPMFGSANTTSTSKPTFYSGLTTFTVLGVNPQKEQIEGWTGRPYNLSTDYDLRDYNNITRRPIEIWLRSEDGNVVEPLRYSMSLTPVVSKSGNKQFVNAVGNFTYGESSDALLANEKMKWFTSHTFRPAFVGEEDLYTFMKQLMCFNERDPNANFIADAERNNITSDALYNNNLGGFRAFVDWCNSNGNTIAGIVAVRKSEKLTAEGQSKTYYNHLIVGKPDYIFRTNGGQVRDWDRKKILEDIRKGTVVTNAMFNVEYGVFDEEDCFNSVPQQTATASSVTGGLAAFLGN